MGTFHHHKHALHGITVVVDTDGPETLIGRCDDIDDARVILLDVDVHHAETSDVTVDAFVRKAAQVGHWPREKRRILDRARVTDVRRLGDIA
ncbi:MAG: hypothetical protein AAF772_17285 [Acidobacteriota bacterium]